MRTNTYRLAVALQAKAIDSIDLHARGVYTAAHSFGEHITVVTRYRTGADQRILQMWALDADAHLLGSAAASTPLGGGIIASHVTAFRGDHLRWERRIIPTAEQYRNPAALAVGTHPARRRSGSTPVAAPITTSATTGHPGARHATPAGHCSSEPRSEVYSSPGPRSTSTPPSATRPSSRPATWSPSDTTTCTGLATARARSHRRFHRHPRYTERRHHHERIHHSPRAHQRPDLDRPTPPPRRRAAALAVRQSHRRRRAHCRERHERRAHAARGEHRIGQPPTPRAPRHQHELHLPSAQPHRVVAARAPQCPALLPTPGG